MKFVNIEAEINRVCLACCGHDRKGCQWLAYGEGEGCSQIQELEGLKVVEAIPIEWLNQKYAENDPNTHEEDYDYYLWNAIAYILTLWEEEQENNNG